MALLEAMSSGKACDIPGTLDLIVHGESGLLVLPENADTLAKAIHQLVENPELRLETIHRQAEGNPIIHVSLLARTEGEIPVQSYGEGVEKIAKDTDASRERLEEEFATFNSETMILCGYNRTRVALNRHIREKLGFEGPGLVPQCLNREGVTPRCHPSESEGSIQIGKERR